MSSSSAPGPSRKPDMSLLPPIFQTDAARKRSLVDGFDEQSGKRRIKRSSKACRSCRAKKRKCGGTAPDPCSNCIAAEEECSWSVEDGRSSAVKRSRLRMAQAMGGKGSGDLATQGQVSYDAVNSTDNTDWLGFMGGMGFGVPSDLSNPTDPLLHTSSFDAPSFPTYPSDLPPGASYPFSADQSTGSFQTPFSSAMQLPSMDDLPTGWPSDVDPFELMMAFSSRMPEVEQTSIQEDTSPASESGLSAGRVSGTSARARPRKTEEGKGFVKVTWWRPHGQTAIAPGLKRMTLKVRVNDETASERALARSPAGSASGVPPIELFMPGTRLPSVPIMKHLGPLFDEFFGSQLPFIDLTRCIAELEAGKGSAFLLNCIAAAAARFSTHPSIALPDLQPHEYGNVFFETAKEMLGSMLAVPVRDTIVALLLLCHVGFANDSEAEEWMFAGMAVRLAIDLGIHLHVSDEISINAEEKRQNRLVFWSVVLLDFALAFGTGRQPTFRVSEISQELPTDEDLPVPLHSVRHPFPYACRMMFSYGRLIELLNSTEEDSDGSKQKEIQKCKLRAAREYAHLPSDMRWDVQNLQRHHQSGRAPIYLQLHLWMHTIIASGHLTGTDYVRRPQLHPKGPSRSGAITPNGVAWRSSARTIGDILVLTDIICPRAYLGLAFCNQAFFVAASCFVKELEQERETRLLAAEDAAGSSRLRSSSAKSEDSSHDHGDGDDHEGTNTLFSSLLATVSTENIEKLRKGLEKQTVFWSGVGWVAEALEQRIRGIAVSEIDLASMEKLATIASLPDAGLAGAEGARCDRSETDETPRSFDLNQWLP